MVQVGSIEEHSSSKTTIKIYINIYETFQAAYVTIATILHVLYALNSLHTCIYIQYERVSSHLTYHGYGYRQPMQYGIDIPSITIKLANVHKAFSHVLFCSLNIKNKRFLFLKPEEYGTRGAKEFLSHSLS